MRNFEKRQRGRLMHRIRLRAPWKSSWNAESHAIVYTRNFHTPTGAEGQTIALKITLLAQDQAGANTIQSVLVNGHPLSAEAQSAENNTAAENDTDRVLRFPLNELEAYNSLELRVSQTNGITGANGPEFEAASIPTFGSFVIESVELLIE